MKKWLLAGIALVVLLTGWHPAPKEPDGLALVRVLGVDGPGPVTLTAVCGGEDQEGSVRRGQCTGADFEEALKGLPWSGREEMSLASVSYLIVGRDVELKSILLAVVQNEKLGPSDTVWLAEEGAAELLGSCADPASALELLERQGFEAPTVVEALAALYEGEELCLPLLMAGEDGLMLIDWEEWRIGQRRSLNRSEGERRAAQRPADQPEREGKRLSALTAWQLDNWEEWRGLHGS